MRYKVLIAMLLLQPEIPLVLYYTGFTTKGAGLTPAQVCNT